MQPPICRSAVFLAPTPPAAPAASSSASSPDSDTLLHRHATARKPGAALKAYSCRTCSTAAFWLRAPSVFSDHRLQRFLVQAQIRHQLPQPRVLIAQLLGFLRFAYIHPAILRLPGIDRVLRHPLPAPRLPTLRPASTCFNAAIICASVCLLLDIFAPSPEYEIILGYVRFAGERSYVTPIKPTFEKSFTFGIPGMANECWFVARHAEAGVSFCGACAMKAKGFRFWRFRSGCLIPTCAAG